MAQASRLRWQVEDLPHEFPDRLQAKSALYGLLDYAATPIFFVHETAPESAAFTALMFLTP